MSGFCLHDQRAYAQHCRALCCGDYAGQRRCEVALSVWRQQHHGCFNGRAARLFCVRGHTQAAALCTMLHCTQRLRGAPGTAEGAAAAECGDTVGPGPCTYWKGAYFSIHCSHCPACLVRVLRGVRKWLQRTGVAFAARCALLRLKALGQEHTHFCL